MEQIKFVDLKPLGKASGKINVAYDRVFNSGTYVGGYEVTAFEREWAEYCDAKWCIGVGNGYDAIVLACKYFIQNEMATYRPNMYVPWKTCIPTFAAVHHGGFRPFPFLDMPLKYYMLVHIYGKITIPDIAYQEKDIIIEDCAQAHGSKCKGIPAGKFGKVAAWSFYPTKNLGALGDAGAVTTDDDDIASFVSEMHKYGTEDCYGINSRLDPMQAAFLRAKLPYLNEWNEQRAENAQAYLDTIIPSSKVKLPRVCSADKPNWHIFAIEVEESCRDDLMLYLLYKGVETKIHYSRVPYPPEIGILEAEKWTRTTLSLPIAPHVLPIQCKMIAELINKWQDV